ncbi:hypothetical protein [Rheinheimera sp.]|uniref:hypothetical protein n=1 Tax=Rheinheimera sp. TaxID=1869214 RepID=UPI0027BB0E57|nr:hypothetical protein [Rheinheimera sp.]
MQLRDNFGGIVEQSDIRTQAILYWQQLPQGSIQVVQDECFRYLLLDGQRQGQMQLKATAEVTYPHLQLVLRLLAAHHGQNILQLGLGAGEFNRAVASRWPERQLSTVEQNPDIIRLYQQFFAPVTTEQLYCAKALEYSRTALLQGRQYQVIFMDLYPWPTDWALLLPDLCQLLTADGMILLNLTQPELAEQLQLFAQNQQCQLRLYEVAGYLNKILLLTPG